MKLSLYIAIIACLISSFEISAKTPLEDATSLFSEGQYQKALEIYKPMVDSNQIQPQLLYNIANCHAKMGNLGLAILNYERALLFNPNLLEAKNNLSIQEELVVDDLNLKPHESNMNKIARSPQGNLWGWMTLFTAILGGVLFFLGFKKQKSTYHIFGLGLSIFCLAFIILAYIQFSNWTSSNYGIVLDDTSLKTEQDINSENSFNIAEGLKLEIIEVSDNWFKVQVKQEQLWIPKKYFEQI